MCGNSMYVNCIWAENGETPQGLPPWTHSPVFPRSQFSTNFKNHWKNLEHNLAHRVNHFIREHKFLDRMVSLFWLFIVNWKQKNILTLGHHFVADLGTTLFHEFSSNLVWGRAHEKRFGNIAQRQKRRAMVINSRRGNMYLTIHYM